jgi:hypothetical protein
MKKIIITFLATAMLATSCKFKYQDDEEQKPKDAVLTKLAGKGIHGKTWKALGGPKQMGLGSPSTLVPDYWNWPDGLTGEAFENGILQNSYTFTLTGQFKPKNTTVTAHWAHANNYFGYNQTQFEDVALVDPNHKQATYKLTNLNNGIGTGYVIEISNGSYMGWFDKAHTYQILSISDDTLRLRNLFKEYIDESEEVARYTTYVAE